MKTKVKIKPAKPKVKIPKIQIDSKGKRFIRIKKRKVILSSKLSERELIAFIIKQLTRKRTLRHRTTTDAKHKEKDYGLPPTAKATLLTPENNPEFFQHQVQLNVHKKNVELQEESLNKRPQLALEAPKRLALDFKPSEILALSPPEYTLAQKQAFVDQFFKEVYKVSIPEAKALVDELKAQHARDLAKIEEDKAQLKKEARQHAILKYRNDILSQLKPPLLKYAQDRKIPLSALPSKITKAQIVADIIASKHDFASEYDKLPKKIPVFLKDKSSASSSSSSALPALASSIDPASQMGNGKDLGLNTDQINHMMSTSKHFLGTIGSDQIQQLNIQPQTPFAFIMNLQKSSQPGSHWVSCFSDGKSSIEYYDSFAEPPTKSFMRDVKWMASQLKPDTYLKFKQNKIVEQDDDTTNCGYFAARFLIDRLRNKPFAECTKYDDHIKGEKDIEAWKGKLHIQPFKYIKPSSIQEGEGLKEIYQGVVTGLTKIKNKVATIAQKGIHAYKAITTGSHRLNFSPSIRALLEKYGQENIASITIARKPIHFVLNHILDWVSQGVFKKNLQALGYDKILHLFMLIRLDNGVVIKAEKNEVISIKETSGAVSEDTESVNIGSVPGTLNQFFQKGLDSVGEQKYYVYDSKTQNCQKWIEANLKANGVWGGSIPKFVLQDAEAIYKDLGYLEKANKILTDVASVANHVLEGAGEKRKKLKFRKV
jgi:hypothetical protein